MESPTPLILVSSGNNSPFPVNHVLVGPTRLDSSDNVENFTVREVIKEYFIDAGVPPCLPTATIDYSVTVTNDNTEMPESKLPETISPQHICNDTLSVNSNDTSVDIDWPAPLANTRSKSRLSKTEKIIVNVFFFTIVALLICCFTLGYIGNNLAYTALKYVLLTAIAILICMVAYKVFFKGILHTRSDSAPEAEIV